MANCKRDLQARNIIDTIGEIRQRVLSLDKREFDLKKVFQKLDPKNLGEVSDTAFNYVLERELELAEIHTYDLRSLLQTSQEGDINYLAFINILFNSNELFKYPLFKEMQEGKILNLNFR